METMKNSSKDNQRKSSMKFVHRIIEYQVDTSLPPGALVPSVKGKVVAALADLDKALQKCDKLNERALKQQEGPLLSYYVKSDVLS